MSRRLLGIVVLGIAFVTAIGVAQSTGQSDTADAAPPAIAGAGHPVAVLDLIRVFNECAQINDLNEMIRRKTEEITKEANQRREVIENKRIELTAFQPGKPDYEARRKDLTRLNIDANVWLKMAEEEIESERFHWTRIIYEQAERAAAKTAKERGYDAVLQRTEFKPFEIEQSVPALRRMIQERFVVYSVPEIDITDLVIRQLDAMYKAGDGKQRLGN